MRTAVALSKYLLPFPVLYGVSARTGEGLAPLMGGLVQLSRLGRRMLRSGSSSLQRLVKMVGRSRQIYKVLCVGVLLQ